LYNQYGLKNYGYLPYLETGNIDGYPGVFPAPSEGTTCTRFLIREPSRGLPENLFFKEVVEENMFSNLLQEERVGDFILQTRNARDENCHNDKPLLNL